MGILEEVQNALSYYQKTAVDEKDTLYLNNIYSQLYYILSVENRPLNDSEFDSLMKALGINDDTQLVAEYQNMTDEQKKQLLMQILQMIDNLMKNIHTMVNY
jgi:3-mercaptopyruvate sulfurtransferase SseA